MRDIALSLVVAALLPWILINPVVGAYSWAWISMMNPHKLTYGFAQHLPMAQIVALTTLIAFAFTRKRYALPASSILVVYVLFMAWMTFTCLFAIAPQDRVIDRWIFVMKIHLMLFVSLMLIRDRKQLEILIWVVTFSVAFYGIKGGIWTLTTGGGGRVWGPPGGLIEGNNELAVALVMLVPFLYYLYTTVANRWARYGMVFSIAVCTFAVLGSQSRGALLALFAMAFFLGLKSKNPVRTSLLLLMAVPLAISFMPDTWTSRMETIQTYETDTSALSRIWVWKMNWAAALDRPIVGVGFVADNPVVFARYAPREPPFDIFAGQIWVAHSIYFQVLGEHGFVGLGLFLLLGVFTWRTASRLARTQALDAEFGPWMPALMRMAQVSLVGFAVGGAFLSLAYFDWPYYVIGYVMVCDALVRRRKAVKSSVRSADVFPGQQANASTLSSRSSK